MGENMNTEDKIFIAKLIDEEAIFVSYAKDFNYLIISYECLKTLEYIRDCCGSGKIEEISDEADCLDVFGYNFLVIYL